VFTIGIVLALVLRAIFIAMGTALLALFLLIFPLFGILLIYCCRSFESDQSCSSKVTIPGDSPFEIRRL
jgi:predicted tellurium resistance membrane protein TerC